MSGPTGIDMSILSATGPTGMIPAGLTVFPPTEPTGETGTVNPIYVFFPSAATGPVEAPHIATIEELMASYGAIVNKEIDDKKTVLVLLNENRESLRVPLFQWAAAGFPASYIVQSVTIEPPSICSDGVSRNYVEYLNYCLGTVSYTHLTLPTKRIV